MQGGTTTRMDVRFFAPPPRLAPYFTTIYRLNVDVSDGGTVTDHLQPEWAGMRLFTGPGPQAESGTGASIDGCRMQVGGPSSLPTRFTLSTTRLWGFGFLPLGWATFVSGQASDHANWIGDGLETECFAPHRALFEALDGAGDDDNAGFAHIVAHFERLDRAHPDRARILAIHEAILEPEIAQVQQLADRCSMTTRTLERLGRKHFGFSPGILIRRQRLVRTLAAFMLEDSSTWSAVIDRNYHDQSHFVREFQQFMAISPSEYAALDHPILKVFMAERMRIWGSPAQTLDRPGHGSGGDKAAA